MFSVVLGCVFGQETLAWRGIVGMPDISKDLCRWRRFQRIAGSWWMADYAHAELVGAALESNGYRCHVYQRRESLA